MLELVDLMTHPSACEAKIIICDVWTQTTASCCMWYVQKCERLPTDCNPCERKILRYTTVWWVNIFFLCGCFSLSASRWSWVLLQIALPSRPLAWWLCQSCPEKVELQLRYSWARLNCSFCLQCLSFPLAAHLPTFLWCTLEQVSLLKWFF